MIRKVKFEEIKEIAKMSHRAKVPILPHYEMYGVEIKGEIVAVRGFLRLTKRRMRLVGGFTLPEYRNQGHSLSLLWHLMKLIAIDEEFAEIKVVDVYAFTSKWYTDNGFVAGIPNKMSTYVRYERHDNDLFRAKWAREDPTN